MLQSTQTQLLAILEQDDNLQINCADETGIYYSHDGNFGYIEPCEYQALIDARD